MKYLKLLVVAAIFLVDNAYSQIECPSCDAYLSVIYDVLHIEKKTNIKQDFKEWFFSNKFEDDYKTNNTSLSITIPIYGVPVTFGGSNESSDAWTKREEVRRQTSWQIDYSAYESIISKKATGDSRRIFLECVKLCYENSGTSVSPVKIAAISANEKTVTVKVSYIYSTGASIPVIVDFTGDGVDLSSTTLYQGQIMNTNGLSINLPWKNQGETSATISINTTRGSANCVIEKPTPNIQVQYDFITYESEMVGTKSMFLQNFGCDNCGENRATIITGFHVADPNNYYKNGRFIFRHNPGGWNEIKTAEYWFEMPPTGRKATPDSATIVTLITRGWGPAFDGDFLVDVYTKRKIINQSTKDVPVINKKSFFSLPSTVTNSYLLFKGNKYSLSTLKEWSFIKNVTLNSNGVENAYEIEFNE